MIPALNASMVLPPFTGASAAERASTSPFEASMSELVERFGTSIPRAALLRGLLSLRRRLRSMNIVDGWQWINGSFVENVEQTRGRSPADLDVVTFYNFAADLPAKRMLLLSNEDVFTPVRAKNAFSCDAYFVDLGIAPELLVGDACYWFGLFSHQRTTNLWKGMLSISLQSDDEAAENLLDRMEQALGSAHHAQKT